MRACSACSTDYDEAFKFCPECGHKFGAAAANQNSALNANLNQMVTSARSEARLEAQLKGGNGQALVTDAARNVSLDLANDMGIVFVNE